MEYKPLTFPLSPEVAADLCDPGSPPEGYVRIVVIDAGGFDKFAEAARPGLDKRVTDFFSEPEDTASYAVVDVPEIILDMLQTLS